MFNKLIFVLPVIVLLVFFLTIYLKGNKVSTCLLFILFLLPLMDLKISSEAWGGFKTFDVICFYSLIFLFKDFITINLKHTNNFYFVLFILLSITILLGGLASEFPDRTYLKLFKITPVFIFGRFFISECLKDRSFHLKAIKALKVAYMASLGFMFIQMLVGLKFTFYPGLHYNTIDPVFHIIRYPGVFYDSQAHGQYLAMGSFLFLYIEDGAKKKEIILNYSVFVLAIAGIIMAGSRAAFGGFAVGLLIVFFMAARQYRIYGSILFVLGFIIYHAVTPESGVFDRAKNLSEDYLFRQNLWKEAFEISKQHPLLGIGSGNYQNYVIRHAQDQYIEIEDGQLVYFNQPENGYLNIIVELGFIGFGIFILFIITPLIKGMIYYIKNIFDTRVTFLMASLISWMVAFNTVYLLNDNRLLIMVVSMIVLITAFPIKETPSEAPEIFIPAEI